MYNVLGFLPVSACFAVLAGMATNRPATRFCLTVLAAFLFSLAIETGQVFLPSRHSSQLDLLCNAAGAFIGASILWSTAYTRRINPSGRRIV